MQLLIKLSVATIVFVIKLLVQLIRFVVLVGLGVLTSAKAKAPAVKEAGKSHLTLIQGQLNQARDDIKQSIADSKAV